MAVKTGCSPQVKREDSVYLSHSAHLPAGRGSIQTERDCGEASALVCASAQLAAEVLGGQLVASIPFCLASQGRMTHQKGAVLSHLAL